MRLSFSALQRAENSSILICYRIDATYNSVSVLFSEPKIPQSRQRDIQAMAQLARFQCSSASRKFLNFVRFLSCPNHPTVSVLFSEPKIPQSKSSRALGQRANQARVSVLFSEPKIPQLKRHRRTNAVLRQFQCSSASRKFLNDGTRSKK